MNGMYPNNPLMMGQPVFNPYVNQIPMNPAVPNYPVVQQPVPHREVDRVNGKESAYAFAMGPNSSVVLVDNLAPKVYLVTTDSSGYKAVNSYRIVPDEDELIQADGKVEETKEDLIYVLVDYCSCYIYGLGIDDNVKNLV